MSSMNASGASLSMVSSDINKFIQLIQDSYQKLAKTRDGFSYADFYSVLHATEQAGDKKDLVPLRQSSEVTSIRATLTSELCSVMSRYTKIKQLEQKLLAEQINGVKRILAGLSILYIVVVISLMLGTYVSAKPYLSAQKYMKAVQIICVFCIILTIVSVLLSLLTLNSRYQLKEADVVKDKLRSRFKTFDTFLFDEPNQISKDAIAKLPDLLTTIDEVNKNPRKADEIKTSLVRKYFPKKLSVEKREYKKQDIPLSFMQNPYSYAKDKSDNKKAIFESLNELQIILSLSFDQQVAYLWEYYTLKIIKNVHREGTGLSRLRLTENKTDPIQILQGTNEILSNYYKLMLKTYQPPDANISNESILRILDNTIVKELKRVDFSTDKSYSNDEIVDKLNQSIEFSLLKLTFKNLLIYMYLPWLVVHYKKLMKLHYPDSDFAKSFVETIAETDKPIINDFMANDAASKEIISQYPLLRSNYIDELRMLENYSTSISTLQQKTELDKFIATSVLRFNEVYDANNDDYFKDIKDKSQSEKEQIYSKYMQSFNYYFDSLYNKLIDNVLIKMNPDKSQLFIFDTQFMRDILEGVIANSNVLKQTNPKYRFYMTDAIINIIVDEQRKRFVQKLGLDFNAEGTNPDTIKSRRVTQQINDVTKAVATAVAPYQITTSMYNKYIYKKVFDGTTVNPYLSSLIDNILVQVDFEASLIRKMKPTLQDDDDTRFVLPQNFISSISSFKYATLIQSLRVDDLKEIVAALDIDSTGFFLDKQKSLARSQLFLTGAIFTSIFGYVLYMTLSHTRFPNFSDLQDVDPVKAFQRLDNEQFQSYNNIIVREIFVSGVPFAMVVLFISIFASFVAKKKADLEFNKERVAQNTNAINTSISKLKTIVDELTARIKVEDRVLPIKNIASITEDDQINLYNAMKSIMSSYDKCNYIIGSGRNELPFPYAEVFADGLMSGVIVCVIIYILFTFAPIERLTELKDLYEYKETAQTLVNDPTFIKEISTKFDCHTDNVESIMMTVKLVFALSIIVFMFVYTTKVVNTSKLYKIGLYNSKYFEKSKCC